MPKTKTFNDILEDIIDLEESNLSAWFRIISENYLSESELAILAAQATLATTNAKQRELSVLYCVSQPYLSVKLRKLRTKIVTLYNFLKCPQLGEQYNLSKEFLTDYQFYILSLILSGRAPKDIAAITGTTHANANNCINVVLKNVRKMSPSPTILLNYILKYKKNFN